MASQSRGVIQGVSVTPTISVSAFTSGDAMHTDAIEVKNIVQQNGSGIIVGVGVADLDKVSGDFDLLFFTADPSTSTVTANAALDLADAELLNLAGHVSVVAADYTAFNDNGFATKSMLVPFDKGTIDTSSATARSLWMILVARDNSDFTTTTALTITVYMEQD